MHHLINTHRTAASAVRLLLCGLLAILLTGCSSKPQLKDTRPDGNYSTTALAVHRTTHSSYITPEASGDAVDEGAKSIIDRSHTSDGYIMIRQLDSSENMKVRMTGPDESIYTYSLKAGEYQTFPLSAGSGTYLVKVCAQTEGTSYQVVQAVEFDANITDEFKPFLYPNQYAWYVDADDTFEASVRLSDASKDDLDFVSNVYHFVIKTMSYDHDKAENVSPGYLPDVEHVLSLKKGICFDYAALMTSLLRMQGVPTKLVIGYWGTQYHAWISVYLDEIGWVDNAIRFDGKNWSLMDPTTMAENDGNIAYTEKYHY